ISCAVDLEVTRPGPLFRCDPIWGCYMDKSEEPKALLSVDSMLNWSDHEGEDEEKGAGDDDDVAGDVYDAAAEFALMGLSSQ
ncbi:hypothetical protein Tco_0560186, partial [Tanacetum coccineum]